mgnify:CR=1 FL=1
MRTSRLIDTYMKHHRKEKPGVLFLREAAGLSQNPKRPKWKCMRI